MMGCVFSMALVGRDSWMMMSGILEIPPMLLYNSFRSATDKTSQEAE
jgi:hypothetical protein